MHITWELVDHLLKPTENVHLWAHDTGRVTVASTRQIASHVRRLPLASLRVEAEQNITNLYKADFNWEHCIMRIVDSPSRRFGRRKCTLCFRMHKPYVLWSTFFGEKRKSKSLKWNWKFFFLLDYAKYYFLRIKRRMNDENIISCFSNSPYRWNGTFGYFFSFIVSWCHRIVSVLSTWTSIGRESR